jgi:hypothetical protein
MRKIPRFMASSTAAIFAYNTGEWPPWQAPGNNFAGPQAALPFMARPDKIIDRKTVTGEASS